MWPHKGTKESATVETSPKQFHGQIAHSAVFSSRKCKHSHTHQKHGSHAVYSSAVNVVTESALWHLNTGECSDNLLGSYCSHVASYTATSVHTQLTSTYTHSTSILTHTCSYLYLHIHVYSYLYFTHMAIVNTSKIDTYMYVL